MHGVVVLHDLVAILKLGHHLVPLLASPDVRPHVLDRLLGDGLEEVILGAEPYAVHDGVRVLVRGHHHHRHLLVEGVVANVVQKCRAVDVGHHDVGEEEVELGAALQEGHRLLAAARRGDCDGLGDAFGDGRVSRNAVRARARGGVHRGGKTTSTDCSDDTWFFASTRDDSRALGATLGAHPGSCTS